MVFVGVVVSWCCRLDWLGVCGEFACIDCAGVGFGWYLLPCDFVMFAVVVFGGLVD